MHAGPFTSGRYEPCLGKNGNLTNTLPLQPKSDTLYRHVQLKDASVLDHPNATDSAVEAACSERLCGCLLTPAG